MSIPHARAFIVSDIGITLAQNSLAAALFGSHHNYQSDERSGIYRWFTDPEIERSMYPLEDQARQGRALVSALRIAVTRRGKQSDAAELAHRLNQRSQEFSEIWDRKEVTRRFENHKESSIQNSDR